MVQRKPDKHDPKEAYARWEFPGGRIDPSDRSPWYGAVREWQEETGGVLPVREPSGGWTSLDKDYQGFIVHVPNESDVVLNPDGHEVSDARWWDPSDLNDPKIRDKVAESLSLVTPLLKSQWSDFHKHTDKILDHYTPRVRDAMADVVHGDVIHNAIRAAYGNQDAEKATKPATKKPPVVPVTTVAPVPPVVPVVPVLPVAAVPAAMGAALGVGIAGAGAALGVGAVAGLGALTATGGLAAALGILVAAPLVLGALRSVLTDLYAEGYMQGSHEAAEACGGSLPMQAGQIPVPPDFWDKWVPGVVSDLAADPTPELADILRQRDIWIHEMTETQVNRIGRAIQRAIENGPVDIEALTAEINAIVNDPSRARMIAETEFSRARTIAARETYRHNNVAEVAWLSQPGACARCLANQAVSPIRITDSWPSGEVPVHPLCRCVEIPASRVRNKPIL